MQAFGHCKALLFLQFSEILQPTSALIELGLALGKRLKTTIFVQRDLPIPFMLEGFSAVAAEIPFLPKARVYPVASATEACRMIRKNGRDLLGLL